MRFKSILGAILFILLASFIALLIFIQSKSFGKLVTSVVSDISQKRFDTDVKIKNFSLSLFPPGVELNKVKVKKVFSPEEKFTAEFGTIGFYLGLIEIEEKKLAFGEIKVSDSYIEYLSPKRQEELKEINPKVIKQIFEAPDKLPLRIDTLILENAKVVLNHELLDAKRIKLFKKGKEFVTRFHLANLRLAEESEFAIDEIWGDGEIGRKNIQIYRLKVQHDVHTLILKGKIFDYYKLKNSSARLNGEMAINLKALKHDFELPEEIELRKGIARASFILTYEKTELYAQADLFIEKLRSNIIYADEIRTLIRYKDQKIILDKLALNYKDQKILLSEGVPLANLSDRSILPTPIKATVTNLSLNNALRFLPKLKILKGKLNGQLTFAYRDRNLFFTPQNKFEVRDLALVAGTKLKPFRILKISKIILNDSSFNVVKGEFQMKASAQLPRSQLQVEGSVSKKLVSFTIPESPVDLEDFGNLANLNIKGSGNLALKVSGPPEHTVLNLAGSMKKFEILGYYLGTTDKNLTVDLGESNVVIHKMEALAGKTHLSGNGSVNWDDAEIALGITSPDAISSDLEMILKPIFKDITFLPSDLEYKAKVDVDIFGKYKLEDLKLRSKVNFSELTAYGENLSAGRFDISLIDQVLAFKKFEAEKGKGTIEGDFSFDLKAKALKLNFAWDNLELASLNVIKKIGLNMNAACSGKISGGGPLNDYSLKLETVAFNTKAQTYNFEDSHVSLNILPNRIMGKAGLLGKMVTADFNLALKHGLASQLNLKFSNNNLKPVLVGLLGQHLEAEGFTGELTFETSTTFQDGFNNLDLTATIKNFSFQHQDFKASYNSAQPEFVVRDSVIQRWNFAVKQPDLFIATSGEGVFGKNVSLVSEAHINSKLLEILFAPILSSEGFLRTILRVEGRGTDFNLSLSSKTSDMDLSIDQLPVQLNNLSYDIEYANNKLNLQKLTTSLDNGSLFIKGDVYFDNNQPDVNLKFLIDKAEIPILGKSSLNLSGEGIVLGNNFPYTIGGEIIINKAQIVNELNEFSNKSAGFSQVRFLPKNQESPIGKMFNISLNIKADNPVRLTNSLMDVAFTGEVRLMGTPSRLKGEGRLSSPPSSSRIFFKNNEYQILSADINFNPKKEISNPDFDIQALTVISTYKVYPKAYGDLERFSFDLTSDPPLPRNSILSLIAFGYTDEIQNSLQSKDQQSLTQVGVGSFVFDRFKISDILNKQFGLQINLGTVIEQSNTDSLLSGRSQDSSSAQGSTGSGRTKSATKIELKKRLDEALTLSVSSTMGGTIGSRQSMNLNYGITRNIQVEGVYELRTNEEGEADIIYNSIGGDLKFRRTFK